MEQHRCEYGIEKHSGQVQHSKAHVVHLELSACEDPAGVKAPGNIRTIQFMIRVRKNTRTDQHGRFQFDSLLR